MLSPQPSALSPQPSALSPQPSALSPQPSALSPQPSALSPQPSALSPQSKLKWGWFAPGFCGASLTLALCLVWSVAQFGSLSHAWLYANGVRVVVDHPQITLPAGRIGEHRDAEFLVRNLSATPIQILGVEVSCGCVTSTDTLPATIPPHGIKALRLSLHLEKTPSGKVEQTIVYHTDEPTAPDLAVTVACRILEANGG